MDTLCFGGSFNPVHHGHLICARAVAEAVGAGRVTLIPNRQSPHKSAATDLATGPDRLTMCRLATAGDPLFDVDDRELSRPGPSFTIDTVRTMNGPGRLPVRWLIGADQVAALPQWREATALLAEVRFVLMARPGWSFDFDGLPPPFRPLRDAVVTAPLVQISSTDVRRRVRDGRPIRYLVPPAVAAYIEEQKLYQPA